jgi:hypothetical protein
VIKYYKIYDLLTVQNGFYEGNIGQIVSGEQFLVFDKIARLRFRRQWGQLRDQFNVTICTLGKPFSILRATLWTKHKPSCVFQDTGENYQRDLGRANRAYITASAKTQ